MMVRSQPQIAHVMKNSIPSLIIFIVHIFLTTGLCASENSYNNYSLSQRLNIHINVCTFKFNWANIHGSIDHQLKNSSNILNDESKGTLSKKDIERFSDLVVYGERNMSISAIFSIGKLDEDLTARIWKQIKSQPSDDLKRLSVENRFPWVKNDMIIWRWTSRLELIQEAWGISDNAP